MKKLLLLSMLFFGTLSFSQDSFVKRYTKCIITRDDVVEEPFETNLAVVFNENKNKVIKFYYPNNEVKTFYQISTLEEGKTKGGYSYQFVEVIDAEDGVKIGLQLFDNDGTLRLIIADGYSLEFYN
jgi:hypothetical protein